MPISKVAVVMGMVLLLLALSVAFLLLTCRPVSAPDLHFVMFTNTPAQLRMAVFGITNPTLRQISFFPAHPQTKTGGVWPAAIRLLPPPSTPTEFRAHTLAGRQHAYFSTTVPVADEGWRVPVLWGFTPSTLDIMRTAWRENWQAFQSGRSLPGLAGLGIGGIRTNFSSEIK